MNDYKNDLKAGSVYSGGSGCSSEELLEDSCRSVQATVLLAVRNLQTDLDDFQILISESLSLIII